MSQLPHGLCQRGKIVDVLQTLADCLQDDGERGILAGDVEKLLRTLALLPQGGALAGVAPRQQKRTRGTLAEARSKERGTAHLLRHDVGDLICVKDEQRAIRLLLPFGKAQDDAVIAGHRLWVHAGQLRHALPHGQRPRGINAAAKRAVQDHAPVP